MRKLLLSFLLMAFTIAGFSQKPVLSEYKIAGSVVDSKAAAIPYANVLLYNSQDSLLIKGIATDAEGKFELLAKPGNYYLKISFLSFQSKIISGIKITDRPVVLGGIALADDSRLLDEVVVTGQKSQFQLNLDKKVFNVGSDITSLGGSAADVLNNVPSVAVEVDGTVTLRGSQNVRILVDGKQSGLVGLKSTDALRQLQGDIIEKIEVITNPSARYDASGEVGIINIVLKKNKNKGLNGIFTANAGYPDYLGGSYSINYRRKNLNIFSNYGISYRLEPGKGSAYQKYSGPDTSFIFSENSKMLRNSLSNNFTFGMDYYFSEKSILTASVLYEYSKENNDRQINYTDFDWMNRIIQSTRRAEIEKANENNIEASLSYKKQFERKDHEFTVDLKWIQTTEPNSSYIKQYNASGINDLNERSGTPEEEYNYLVQADYVQPFLGHGKIETGIKSSLRIVNSDYFYERQDISLNWVTLPAYVNNLAYSEKIHAAYLMSSYEFERISFLAGLRGEFSDITTELKESDNKNQRKYLDLFPSAFLSYKLNDLNTLQLSYSRRINRPGFRDLMPYNGFGDSRILFQGNPDLNPEYTDSYEAGYKFDQKKFNFMSTVYYRHRTGVIQRFSSVDSAGVTHVIPLNLSKQNAYGLELNFSYETEKNFRLNSNFNFYKAVTEGKYNQQDFTSETYSWTNRSSLIVKLLGCDFQTTLNYRAPRITPQGRELSSFFVDLGLNRDIFKGKGTLAVNVRDLFNTRKRSSIVDSEGLYSKSENQFHMRQIIFTLTYRLNRDASGKGNKEQQENGNEQEF